MANRGVREDAVVDGGQVLRLRPVMESCDLFTDASQLPGNVSSRSENLDVTAGTMDRRMGAVKLARLNDPTTAGKSRTFAATTKYATFTPPLIPVGGFFIETHFITDTPTGSNVAFVVGARPNGQTYHVFKITSIVSVIPNAGNNGDFTVEWRDSAGATHTVAAFTADEGVTIHLFCVYDPLTSGGKFTVYVNGAVSGTPLTSLGATLKPAQDASVVWTLGVEKETGAAVTANSNFDGAIDGIVIGSLRGLRPSSGDTTLIEVLRRHSARAWPRPDMDFILFCADCDEASGTVMTDRSQAKAHGAYVGGPTVSDPVALLAAPLNLVAQINVPDGGFNVVASRGALFYERTAEALS